MTPLDFITDAVTSFPDRVAFKVPKNTTNDLEEWKNITYKEFADDVRDYARYWTSVLQRDGIKQRDIIVLW